MGFHQIVYKNLQSTMWKMDQPLPKLAQLFLLFHDTKSYRQVKCKPAIESYIFMKYIRSVGQIICHRLFGRLIGKFLIDFVFHQSKIANAMWMDLLGAIQVEYVYARAIVVEVIVNIVC